MRKNKKLNIAKALLNGVVWVKPTPVKNFFVKLKENTVSAIMEDYLFYLAWRLYNK